MDKLQKIIEVSVTPIAEKLGRQRHLQAIKDGIILTLPLILIGSFFLLLLSPPGESFKRLLEPYASIISIPYKLTYGLIALYVSFSIAYCLAKSYKMDSLSCGIISLVTFLFCAVPRTIVTLDVQKQLSLAPSALGRNLPPGELGWNIPIRYLGTDGLFLAIICAVITVEILRYLQGKKLIFKMPESVPEGVARSFESILPAFITITFFWITRDILKVEVAEIISMVFMPIVQLGDSLVAVLLLAIIDSLVWFAGIHPVAITGPLFRVIGLKLIADNAAYLEVYGKGAILPHIAVDQFYFWFVWIGGSGATLGLVIMLLFTKSKYLKNLTKICSIPGIFNINEPVVFGLPIIGNPLMIIPFTIAPLVNGILAYSAFYFNLIQRPYITAPWTLPVPLGAYYSTGGDWRALVLSLIIIAISCAIYYPFVKIYDRQMLADEAKVDQPDTEENTVKNPEPSAGIVIREGEADASI